jgi:hypothetical protein
VPSVEQASWTTTSSLGPSCTRTLRIAGNDVFPIVEAGHDDGEEHLARYRTHWGGSIGSARGRATVALIIDEPMISIDTLEDFKKVGDLLRVRKA